MFNFEFELGYLKIKLELVLERSILLFSSRDLDETWSEPRYVGFWITVRNDELALGKIGSPLVQPLITWNDTLREGPRDPFYFGLTTDKVS